MTTRLNMNATAQMVTGSTGEHVEDARLTNLPTADIVGAVLDKPVLEGRLKDATDILARARMALKRFAERYAESPQAKAASKEARLIVEAIDEWMLRQ